MPFCELVIDLKFTIIVRSLHPLSLVNGIMHCATVSEALLFQTLLHQTFYTSFHIICECQRTHTLTLRYEKRTVQGGKQKKCPID